MISQNKERTIGKVVTVGAYKIEAELLESINSFNINGFDDIYQFIRLNGYVLVKVEQDLMVASISAIRESDSSSVSNTDKNALNKANAIKILELFPLGTISANEFKFGVSNYPMLYSDVIYIKEKELNQLFSCETSEEKRPALSIGHWTLMDKYKVKIDIDNFFGFHSAVLGNTGSGKSCTISAILQSVFSSDEYGKAQFLFFDVNGEYRKAFIQEEQEKILSNIELQSFDFDENNSSKFYLPLNLLTIDEWELLLKASSKTQAPILRTALSFYELCSKKDNSKKEIIKTYILCRIVNALLTNPEGSQIIAKISAINSQINLKSSIFRNDTVQKKGDNVNTIKFLHDSTEKEMYNSYSNIVGAEVFKIFIGEQLEQNKVDDLDLNYSNSCNIELEKLIEYIDIAILWEEAHGNKQIRDYCSSMITRLKSLTHRKEFDFFKRENGNEVNGISNYMGYLLNNKNITIINFDNIDDEVIEVVSAIITRIIFDYTKRAKDRNKKTIHLVLDEAHRYISKNKNKDYYFEANRIFERVAKEARKYGLFLMLSSQRPSELNETVLSQCSNFIIHRIQNPDDLYYIRSMTPFISKAILDQLPSIPKQEALIFGSATNLPVLFKVKDANPLPYSKNNDISKNWKNEL